MAITEVVILHVRQDSELVAQFSSGPKKHIQKILAAAPGIKTKRVGRMMTENNIPLPEYAFRSILGLTWVEAQNFYDFIASDEFKALAVSMKPLASGPSELHIFETDVEAEAAYSSPLTEVYLINITKLGSQGAAQAAWNDLVTAIKISKARIHSLSGPSLKLEEKEFVGVMGWEGIEARDSTNRVQGVAQARAVIEALGEFHSFTAQLGPFEST